MAEVLSAEQLSEVFTTSTSAQVALTTSPTVAGGTYLVLVTYEVNLNKANTTNAVEVRTTVDGTVIGEHDYYAKQTSDWHPGCHMRAVALAAGARTLKVEFWNNVSTNSPTAKVRNVRIFAWSVDLLTHLAIGPYSTTESSAYYQPLLAPAGAPVNGATYLMFWSAEVASDTTSRRAQVQAQFAVGTTVVDAGSGEIDFTVAGAYVPVGGFRYFSVAATPFPAFAQLGFKASASGATITARRLAVAVIRVIDGVTAHPDFVVGATAETVTDQTNTTGTLAVASQATFTAVASKYLLLAMGQIRGSAGTVDAVFDVRHAASAIFGQGQVRVGASAQRLPFMAHRYADYTAGSVTDDVRFARGASGSVVIHDSRVVILKIGLQANITETATIQADLVNLFGKLIDAETATFTDAVDLIHALAESATAQDIAFSDILTLLSQRDFTDAFSFAEGVLALLLPTRQTAMTYLPVQLVELLLASGTRYYATRDIYVSSPTGLWADNTLFKGNQLTFLEPMEFSVDQLLGMQGLESIEVAFDNSSGEFTSLRTEECRNRFMRVWEWDEATGELTLLFVGKISRRPSLGLQASFEASMQSLPLFNRDFPFRTITTEEFHRAAPEAVGKVITQVWGSVRKIPMRLIDADENPNPPPAGNWTYLLYEKCFAQPSLGWLSQQNDPSHVPLPTVTAIYRNGRLIDPSEYTLNETAGPYSERYVTATFARDQKDFKLCFDTVQSDYRFRNPAIIVQGLLAGYGLEAVDAASFAQARADLDAEYVGAGTQPAFDFAIAEEWKFVDVLNELLFRMRLGRNEAGQWTCTVDKQATRAMLRIGMGGDGNEFLNAEVGPLTGKSIEEMPAAFEIYYAWNRGFLENNGRFVFAREVPGAAIADGKRERIECHFVTDHATAEAIVQFRAQYEVASEEQCEVVIEREGRKLRRGDVVLVSVPLATHGIVNEPFRVISAALGMVVRRLVVARYGPEIYAFSRNALLDPADPAEPPEATTPDYTFTPPPAPIGLSVEGWVARRAELAGGDGQLVLSVKLRALLPGSPKNGTSVVFKWRPAGEPLIAHFGDETPISSSQWGTSPGVLGTIGPLTPGVKYDFYAYLHNANNDPGASAADDAQNGAEFTITNQLAPENITTPPSMAGWVISVSSIPGAIKITVQVPALFVKLPPGIRAIKVYRRGDPIKESVTEANLVSEGPSTSIVDDPPDTTGGEPYYYFARLVDVNGQVSDDIIGPPVDAFGNIVAARIGLVGDGGVAPGVTARLTQRARLSEYTTFTTFDTWIEIGSVDVDLVTTPGASSVVQFTVDLRYGMTHPAETDVLELQITDTADDDNAPAAGPIAIMRGYGAGVGVSVEFGGSRILTAANQSGSQTYHVKVRAASGTLTDFRAGEVNLTILEFRRAGS